MDASDLDPTPDALPAPLGRISLPHWANFDGPDEYEHAVLAEVVRVAGLRGADLMPPTEMFGGPASWLVAVRGALEQLGYDVEKNDV